MSINEYHDAGTWRDSVERRMGSLEAGLQSARQTDDRLHTELRDLKSSIEHLRADLSAQISSSIGGLRADVLALRTSPPQSAPAPDQSPLDWKLVATVAALLAGGLVGVGISVGRAWQVDDTKALVRTLAP
jgi:hypothetical protein